MAACTPAHEPGTVAAHIVGATGLTMRHVSVRCLPDLPRLASGKIDYAELRRPAERPASAESIAEVFRRCFHRRPVRPEDSFTSLAGDSLRHVELSMEIERLTGALPCGWERMSIADLAAPGHAPGREPPQLTISLLVRRGLCAVAPGLVAAGASACCPAPDRLGIVPLRHDPSCCGLPCPARRPADLADGRAADIHAAVDFLSCGRRLVRGDRRHPAPAACGPSGGHGRDAIGSDSRRQLVWRLDQVQRAVRRGCGVALPAVRHVARCRWPGGSCRGAGQFPYLPPPPLRPQLLMPPLAGILPGPVFDLAAILGGVGLGLAAASAASCQSCGPRDCSHCARTDRFLARRPTFGSTAARPGHGTSFPPPFAPRFDLKCPTVGKGRKYDKSRTTLG